MACINGVLGPCVAQLQRNTSSTAVRACVDLAEAAEMRAGLFYHGTAYHTPIIIAVATTAIMIIVSVLAAVLLIRPTFGKDPSAAEYVPGTYPRRPRTAPRRAAL
jgi:hypothetical protein